MRFVLVEVMSVMYFSIKEHLFIAGEIFLFKITALHHYQLIWNQRFMLSLH